MNDSLPISVPVEAPAVASSPWSALVERVRNADPYALEELYRLFSKGIRFYLWRHLGPQDLEDRVHDAFLAVTQSIQNDELRQPERLLGFVRTVVRRQVATQIESAVHARRNRFSQEMLVTLQDRRAGPEETAIRNEYQQVAMRLLQSIPERDREVLIRFYLREQPAGEICREMKLTDTQFRLIKSRAKARFGELGRARLARRKGFLNAAPTE
jgi:RNA polymerase sigma-70 factor, ECF subfamily